MSVGALSSHLGWLDAIEKMPNMKQIFQIGKQLNNDEIDPNFTSDDEEDDFSKIDSKNHVITVFTNTTNIVKFRGKSGPILDWGTKESNS